VSDRSRFVRLPPGAGNVLVPAGSRRGAASGVSLLTFCRWLPLICQRGLYAAVWLAGPRALPGRRIHWDPPQPLVEAIGAVAGVDAVAIYQRPQASRGGVGAVLCRNGHSIAFVKTRPDPAELERERAALDAFAGRTGDLFRVPRVLDHAATWLMLEAMPARPTRPWRSPPVERISVEVGDRLATAIPKPRGTPDHWRPMHGDLTPWNLRTVAGERWIIDWEGADWAPPYADEVYHAAVMNAVFGTHSPHGRDEAVDFWIARVAGRANTDHDARLNARLVAALERMRA
jgi:Phosphotransferase enzyme family